MTRRRASSPLDGLVVDLAVDGMAISLQGGQLPAAISRGDLRPHTLVIVAREGSQIYAGPAGDFALLAPLFDPARSPPKPDPALVAHGPAPKPRPVPPVGAKTARQARPPLDAPAPPPPDPPDPPASPDPPPSSGPFSWVRRHALFALTAGVLVLVIIVFVGAAVGRIDPPPAKAPAVVVYLRAIHPKEEGPGVVQVPRDERIEGDWSEDRTEFIVRNGPYRGTHLPKGVLSATKRPSISYSRYQGDRRVRRRTLAFDEPVGSGASTRLAPGDVIEVIGKVDEAVLEIMLGNRVLYVSVDAVRPPPPPPEHRATPPPGDATPTSQVPSGQPLTDPPAPVEVPVPEAAAPPA